VLVDDEIGPAARRETDLEAAASHFAGNRAYRLVLADLAFFELGHPYLSHALRLENAHILFADYMPLGQQLFPAGAKHRAAKDPAG
jgi:hypothetical protein